MDCSKRSVLAFVGNFVRLMIRGQNMTISELLETKANVYHLDGVSVEQITEAENALGFSFSEDYVEYLKEYGLLSYGVHELTGICKSSRLNVVDATKREKADNSNIVDDMYLLEMIGVENLTIWQNSNGEIFEVAYKNTPKKICDSLVDYIERF